MLVELSIVIVNYNVEDLLRDCLTSIFQQSIDEAQLEVIVVDNHSSDGSVDMVKKYFPQVRLISNLENVGFSAANNQGLEIATGNYFFLLNPDTVLRADVLHKFLFFASENKELFLLGPRLEEGDGTLQISVWKQPGTGNVIAESFFLHRLLHVSEYERDKFNFPFSPEMISGAALFFPRSLYEKIGGLDATLFWMEDADFSRRAKNAGARLVYFPGAVVVHYSGQSSKKNQKITISNQLLSKLKYIKKYSGAFMMSVASFFCFIQIASRIFIFFILSPFSASFREKLSAYVWTFAKFFRYLFVNDNRVN